MRSAAPARVAEICAGYGGNLRALRQAGFDVDLAWYAEKDADASTVMAHHHPDVPNLGDITTVDWEQASPVDVITAGYPCQSFSHAGKRKGFEDERAVWPYVADAIRSVRPRLVLLENVAGHLARGIDRVLWDLASLGYVGAWLCVRASDLGAPHRRDRVFIAARPVDADPGTVWPRRVRAAALHRSDVGCGPVDLLPTPGARLGDGRGAPSADVARNRYELGRRNLDVAAALLPTPSACDAERGAGYTDQEGRPLSETVMRLLPAPTASDGTGGPGHGSTIEGSPSLRTSVTLLPTPRASDGDKGGPNQRGSSGDLALSAAVQPERMLLPTPMVADARGTRNATASRTGSGHHDGWTLSDVAYDSRWGQYAAAITRWERITGRPAPPPTEPGRRGNPRLSALFVEWMMGLPDGYVTSVVGRNQALRLLGNGLVPVQGALAFRSLELSTVPVQAAEAVA